MKVTKNQTNKTKNSFMYKNLFTLCKQFLSYLRHIYSKVALIGFKDFLWTVCMWQTTITMSKQILHSNLMPLESFIFRTSDLKKTKSQKEKFLKSSGDRVGGISISLRSLTNSLMRPLSCVRSHHNQGQSKDPSPIWCLIQFPILTNLVHLQ